MKIHINTYYTAMMCVLCKTKIPRFEYIYASKVQKYPLSKLLLVCCILEIFEPKYVVIQKIPQTLEWITMRERKLCLEFIPECIIDSDLILVPLCVWFYQCGLSQTSIHTVQRIQLRRHQPCSTHILFNFHTAY